ncbi:MAG TPA: phosphoribosylamine--glycine ligase [Dehalococcoidia bacterium]|jgi:phosphoribosylamine--glycine ligase|nr:phosphoribosylamine--glycine ligase [Dehalococcoidia bacterium]
MNVLLVGSGAREHALAWKLRQSPRLNDLFTAPGNAGTAAIATNVDVKASDVDGLVDLAKERRADLVIVGPEDPLSRGLVDRLAVEGIAAFGPTQAAARIESSKAFSKDLMVRHGIPTASSRAFQNRTDARNYVASLPERGLVVKADGLAAGKGVFVCDTKDEALAAIEKMMGGEAIVGASGSTVLIEERLTGREVSAMAFTDGLTVAPMPFSCDYKRIGDGDEGPNTGGMGAYSPALWLDEALEAVIHEGITEAAVQAMMGEGVPFRGVLYPGLMITADGPKVIEFNCRFGDPEAQVLIPRLKSDLLEICLAVVNNRLADAEIEWSSEAAIGVVIASGGYPDDYTTGYEISGLGSLEDGVLVFHGGTAFDGEGRVVTSGGRVLTVVATGPSLPEARAAVYRNVQRIHFRQAYYRRDIAAPAQNARVE